MGGNEATNKHKHPDNALLGALTQCGQEYAIAILALGSWSSKPRIDFIGKIFFRQFWKNSISFKKNRIFPGLILYLVFKVLIPWFFFR